MPQTLIGAKPELQEKIRSLLQSSAYEAFMTANQPPADIDPVIAAHVQESTKDAATKFSNAFAYGASGPFADAIYEFVREIAITMVAKGTLVAGTYPVTGAVGPSDFIIS